MATHQYGGLPNIIYVFNMFKLYSMTAHCIGLFKRNPHGSICTLMDEGNIIHDDYCVVGLWHDS